VLSLEYLTIHLNQFNWRDFVHSSNPIAACFLPLMRSKKSEKLELRKTFLLMLSNLNLPEDKLSQLETFFRIYCVVSEEEDQAILQEIAYEQEQKGVKLMAMMNSWELRGFQRGKVEGIEQGIELGREEGIVEGFQQGIEQGIKQGIEKGHKEKQIAIAKNLLALNQLDLPTISDLTDLTLDEIKSLIH
jgi:flagellar biosynthesis/type III secretory pathway protein FliH